MLINHKTMEEIYPFEKFVIESGDRRTMVTMVLNDKIEIEDRTTEMVDKYPFISQLGIR